MRKLLNTLYVTTPESYLVRDGLNLAIRLNDREVFRIPIHNLEGVVTFGYCGASPGAMQLCMENNVSLSFLSQSGRFMGRVSGGVNGNVLLRKTQYRVSERAEESLAIARLMIAAKICNSRYVLQRFLRDYGENDAVSAASAALDRKRSAAIDAASADSLRGVEGDAANSYFGVFDRLITGPRPGMEFRGRSRRPPKDPVNAMLSFCYTMLAHEVQSALETVGLDPYVGFFHTDRPGRIGLALDMMEEMRAYVADRFVLSLINRRQITVSDFVAQSDESYVLTDDARKSLISAWQKRKQDTITHPYLDEKIPLGLLPYAQAMLMARFLRGDIDNYPVFIAK